MKAPRHQPGRKKSQKKKAKKSFNWTRRARGLRPIDRVEVSIRGPRRRIINPNATAREPFGRACHALHVHITFHAFCADPQRLGSDRGVSRPPANRAVARDGACLHESEVPTGEYTRIAYQTGRAARRARAGSLRDIARARRRRPRGSSGVPRRDARRILMYSSLRTPDWIPHPKDTIMDSTSNPRGARARGAGAPISRTRIRS